MRFLSGLFGAVVGLVVLSVSTLWLTLCASGDDGLLGLIYFAFFWCVAVLPVGLYAGNVCALNSYDFLHRPDPDGTLRVKKWRLGTLLTVGPLVAVVLPIHVMQHEHDPPSDAAMLAHFAAHRAELDALAQMVQHDKYVVVLYPERVNYDTEHAVQVSPARIALYRQKLKQAGVQGFERSGETRDEEGDFRFSSNSNYRAKDFAYRPKPPASTLPSLDGLETDTNYVPFYRHIDGCWYLRYETYGD